MADLILQEQIDSRIEVHSAETNNIPRNDETANKAFDDETTVKVSIKQKTKRGQKTKEISGQEKHLEDQLIQCKARIAMLEDVNRDYKNTINLLRSQLEIKTVMSNVRAIKHKQTQNLTLRASLTAYLRELNMSLR